MKRGRKPKGLNTLKVHKEADQLGEQQNQYLGPSLEDLPEPISFDILLRLSTKSLLTCRCVCKPWRKLISDPEFARLHFARAEAFPLIRFSSSTYVSRNLYLVEPPEDSSGFDTEYCDRHMKLETKLKIPLRNAELVMNREGDANADCNSKGGVKRKRCIKLRPKDHMLNVVNSCNGLLCLSEPSLSDPVMPGSAHRLAGTGSRTTTPVEGSAGLSTDLSYVREESSLNPVSRRSRLDGGNGGGRTGTGFVGIGVVWRGGGCLWANPSHEMDQNHSTLDVIRSRLEHALFKAKS
ncbi:hypothetical protein RHSIM_RhsimUnG0082900 [Rhododendron simsii]|uniref:F-box domain-containing protein n=1 Tax=Rhododendron simsii TaxID=118357 RepID=A0A834FW45_RHOSS|nr:hypothetical protein RHSIM_RhsimUnG0082900 [Rhododendron simsii]